MFAGDDGGVNDGGAVAETAVQNPGGITPRDHQSAVFQQLPGGTEIVFSRAFDQALFKTPFHQLPGKWLIVNYSQLIYTCFEKFSIFAMPVFRALIEKKSPVMYIIK